ncbi:MAG: hypothetical protein M3063_14790 [Actinomycetota bacterium]|nr:hypothetical protein [Actinomycetota bacterium]
MISIWWWVPLGVAGLSSVVLGVVARALRAERQAVVTASTDVDRARAALGGG